MRLFKLCLFAFLLLSLAGTANAQKPVELKPTPRAPVDNSPAQREKNIANAQLLLDIFVTEQQAQLYALSPEIHKEYADAGSRLFDLYAKAIKQPAVLSDFIGKPFTNFIYVKEHAKGAAQVSHGADEVAVRVNIILVAQNQRIIELLEQLVKKK